MKPFNLTGLKNMRLLKSQSGFTITELIVVIAISGFLMAAAATGFSAFFAKFNDMSKTMELQRDAFNCMQTIKSGVPIGSGTGLKFQGIATADSVVFVGTNAVSSNNIILYPPVSDYTHASDFIRIYHDGRYVRATYLNGTIQPPSPLYLFPKPTRGNETTVTRLRFIKANSGQAAKVIIVELDARVKLRKDVYKTVSYSTKMALTIK
jgi:prepilin-type N-terminal cleavage/methylation domain-containing protein